MLEKSITEVQLREWAAFFGVEPWGAEVEWWQTGIIAASIINASPNLKRGVVASPKDFMPKSMQEKPVENVRAFITSLRAVTSRPKNK